VGRPEIILAGPTLKASVREVADRGLALFGLNHYALVAEGILKPRRAAIGAEEEAFVRVFQPF
jgi:hypothetical protein